MNRSAAVVNPEGERRRRCKTVPAESTGRLLQMLEAYLAGKPNRKRSAQVLLGCSHRTAGRITSRRRPYVAPMKLAWAERICHANGKTLDSVLGVRKPKTWQQSVLGWAHARTPTEALQLATDCALAIIYRALVRYELSGSFALDFRGGYPREITIALSAAPEVSILGGSCMAHQIIVSTEVSLHGGGQRMMLKHVWPGAPAVDRDVMTADLVDRTLRRIKDGTKGIVTKFQKEVTNATRSSRSSY